MSGFCCVWNGKGDRAWAAGAMAALRSRGEGPARLESAGPLSVAVCGVGGVVKHPAVDLWLMGEVRLDGRAELARALGAPPAASGAELLLDAYLRWGVECAGRVAGDISAAIYDGRDATLFCLRDHFGVLPFFHAATAEGPVFGDTLAAVKAVAKPDVDELFIADLLMFDGTWDAARTAFEGVRRLPAAHRLIARNGATRVERYWSFPVDEPVRFRRLADYPERFNELLSAAVRDRLTGDRVSVLLSGGLDSGTLAMEASAQLGGLHVKGHSYVYDWLIPDDERAFVDSTARAAGIEVRRQSADRFPLYEGWERPDHVLPEPVHQPFGRLEWLASLREMAAYGGEALYGEGPDEMLRFEWRAYLRSAIERGAWGLLGQDLVGYLSRHKRVPGWRLPGRDRPVARQAMPPWLEPDFVGRHDLGARWDDLRAAAPSLHPYRPAAHAILGDTRWPALFESMDPGFTGVPLRVRHPFFDLRMARFLMSLPVLTWCRRKQILREAGRRLPAAVRTRRKTPLAADPVQERVRREGPPPAARTRALARFVHPTWTPPTGAEPLETWRDLRPVSLSYWLSRLEQNG